jgi:tetratricopeptide (TPR) repeat protein
MDEWLYDARYFRKTDQLERAIAQYERVLRYSKYTDRMFTESAFCLGESFYFIGKYDNAVSMYYKCNLDYIEDENDFYIHIGHALLDAKMKHYENELRTYYRGCLDRSYAMEHMREVERAASEVAAEFEEYEKTCLAIGKKKYNEHIESLPMKDEGFNSVVMEEIPVKEVEKTAENRYSDVKLVKPRILADTDTISLNETMSEALRFLSTGDYQRAYELYYKLSQSLDPESDYATWVNFQLGKLYCICDDAQNSFEALSRCRPGKFGVVYRQSDFFLLYTHVRTLCDDFESDENFRKLIRGRIDDYYARFDTEYISLRNDNDVMARFRRYEKECMNAARVEFSAYAFTEEKAKPGRSRRKKETRENRVLRGISRYFNE